MLNVHLSVHFSLDPSVCFEAMKTFDVFFTPVCILRRVATQVVTGHVMSRGGILPDSLAPQHDIVLRRFNFTTINFMTELLKSWTKEDPVKSFSDLD